MIKRILVSILFLALINPIGAQDLVNKQDNPPLITEKNRGTSIKVDNIKVGAIIQALKNCPSGESLKSVNQTGSLTLTLDKTQMEFDVIENNTMSKAFKKAEPTIKSYTLKSGSTTGRLTVTPMGTRGYLFTNQGMVSIYPTVPGSPKRHTIEYGAVLPENGSQEHIECAQHGAAKELPELEPEIMKSIEADLSNGTELRTYRFAVVCTGEFYQANGNNTTEARATVTASVEAYNELYGRDASINFNLLTPRIFTNPLSDPFIEDQAGTVSRTNQAGIQVPKYFPAADFDIGHVFHKTTSGDGWSGGGVAYLASVCNENTFQAPNNGGTVLLKAGGWSGSFSNNGFGWISLSSHEIGHMFNCPHTFNGSGSNCDDNISTSTAYEIGSGTTIMSYNGTCGSGQNIGVDGPQNLYFHANSLIRMITYSRGGGNCAAITPTGNIPPDISADPCGHNGNFSIPKSTPFILKGEAIDLDGDIMDFGWEQYNEDGSSATPTQGFIGSQAAGSNLAPLFRSYPPSPSGLTRYFPNKESVNEGITEDFDVLPAVPRTLSFQLIARDKNPNGGGVSLEEIEIPVAATGPLRVNMPNNSSVYTAGEMTTITWSTTNSDNLCNDVDILLSTNGGQSFDFVLASNINYSTQSRMVTIPPNVPNTSEAKVMIKCVDSECIQFYNVNRGYVDVISDCNAQSLSVCPNDPVSFNQGDPGLALDLNVFSGAPFTDKSVTLLPSNLQYRPAAFNNGVCSQGFLSYTQEFRVSASQSGSYRIFIDNWQNGGMSMYTADNFDPNNPCASALGSNYRPSSVGNNFTVELVECEEYVLLFHSFDPGVTISTAQIISASPLIEITPTDPDYGETYIAVNQFGRVIYETPTGDFVNSPSGILEVYGVNYKRGGAEPPTNVDPTTWVGQLLEDVYNSGDCFALSPVPKPVEIISSCNITMIEYGNQGACSDVDNTYSQEMTITYLMEPTGNLLVKAGDNDAQSFPITTSPQTVTLVNLISTGEDVDVIASFEENPGCVLNVANAYKAPENCCVLSVDIPDEINACGDEMVVLNAGADGTTYEWTLDGAPLSATEEEINADVAGLYAVTVTTASGCAKPDQTDVNFFDNPIVSVDAMDTTGCDGEQLVINIQANDGTITWYKDGIEITGQVDNEIRVTEQATYTGRATALSGCFAEANQFMTFAPSPDVELGIDRQLCEGDPLVLNAGDDGIEYNWFRDGNLLVGENGNMLNVDIPGMYSVSVLGQAECTSEDMMNVEIYPLPIANLGGDTAICAGTPVTIFTNSSNVTNYTYFKDGLETLLPNLNQITITEGGTYELIIENEIGCEIIQSILVVENDLPVVDLDPEKIGCVGSDVLLESPIMGGRYSWTFNGVEISNESTVSVSQEGMYQLLVADDFGCEGMDQIEVSFVPGPTLSIDGAQDFCAGGMATLAASTTGDNIQWSRDGVDLMGATDFTLDVSQAGVYKASVSGSLGCIVEDQVSIEVFENPTVDAGAAIVICEGDSEDRTLQTTGDGLMYDWTLNGTSINANESITVTEDGTYRVTVTNTNNCTAEDDFMVRVSALPTVQASVSSLDICDGIAQDVSITTDATRIEWYRNGNLISGETSTTLGISQDGAYEVIVYNDDNCSAMTSLSATSRPSPNVDLGDDQILCPNESLNIEAGSHTLYDWSDGSSGSSVLVDNPNMDIQTSTTLSVQVTNEFNCTAEDEVVITFRPIITGDLVGGEGVCAGDSVSLTASGGINYAWNDPNGTLSSTDQASTIAKPAETTTYSVVISDDCPNNTDELSATVEVFPPAMAFAGEDTLVILGRDVTLMGSGGVNYVWTDEAGNVVGNSQNTSVMPTEKTTYNLLVTDSNGCTARSSVSVDVNQNPLASFEAVNVITPNGDGDNDELYFIGLETESDNTLMIYNRWGNLVFEATGYQTTGGLWDGTKNGEELPADTYYYVLKFSDQVYKSAITIVRD